VDILGGSLGGTGTIQGTVLIGAAGVMNPGNSPGTLNVDNAQFGNLVIEIASATVHDIVNASGTVTFSQGSTIRFDLLGGYVPADGADIEFLFASALEGLDYVSYSIVGLPSSLHYQVYADGGADLHVRFYGSQAPGGYVHQLLYDGRSVPAPSTTALTLLGLALLGWRYRRRGASGR
jgi:hypothetical protein